MSEIMTESYSWYLELNQEILDAELLAIFKALSKALKIIRNSSNNPNKDIKIYIYTDSQAAIQRLEKIADLGPGRDIVQKCAQLALNLRDKGAKTTIR
jgi:ribonuclease HI